MRTATDRRSATISVLARHPTVVEVVRIASALSDSSIEVVVFEAGHAMVVGSLAHLRPQPESGGAEAAESGPMGQHVLQPRPLSGPETELVAGTLRHASDSLSTSTAIVDRDGTTIGALSVAHGAEVPNIEVLLGLSRVCSSLLESAGGHETHHEALLESLRDAVIVLDANMVITYANQAIGLQIGRSAVEVVGTSVLEYLHPDDVTSAFDALVRLSSGAQIYRIAVRVLHGSGEYIRLEVTGNDMASDPLIGGTLLSLRNGDYDLELESTLERTRQLSDALLEQLHDGIIATDALGSLLVANHAALKILGLPSDTVPATLAIDALEILDAEAMPFSRHSHPIRRALSGEHITSEAMSVVADGQLRSIMVSGRPVVGAAGATIGAAIGFHDVTEARQAQRELRRAALHDQLTGLPNRRQLKERVDELQQDAVAGDRRPVTECLIDLDNFKVINDTHGHRIGDRVIRVAAQRLSVGRRPDDLLVRLGGDEFVVLSRGYTSETALVAAEQMRRQLSKPFVIDGHMFSLTCSIGVAHVEIDDVKQDALLRFADLALYAAKARGRNRVALFDTDLAEEAQAGARQREFLRQALDEDSLVMHLQPLIDAATDEIVGFESLARCRTRAGTLIGPAQFLEAASGSGLVWDLDRQAFDLTCRATARLSRHLTELTVAANFSGLSVVQPEFVEFVDRTIARHQVSPSSICIEITESAAFEAGPAALVALRTLHELGVKLALDDFGTGYSSLSHLRDLPLAVVKVDRSFIAKLDESSSERSIAEAVVKLADGLGFGVVAEGVETSGQLAAARAIGFDTIQGWYYSQARSLEEILQMLSTRPTESAVVPNDWGRR